MRLLEFRAPGEFSLTKDYIEDIPRYAILSHTWGADNEEVTFYDFNAGAGRDKIGYKKIQFCGEQAARDGLRYFWVDTCCINKSNATELSEAINSMFRWYQNAVKCYVYLSDVSTINQEGSDQYTDFTWKTFRASKWFTRGWTLLELLAPEAVEFFSQECKLLGDKRTLENLVIQITGIPALALRGAPLSQFEIDERLSWASSRRTKYKEDEAYSLLGIFDVFMPLIYGEGRNSAFRRLYEEIERYSKDYQDTVKPLHFHPLIEFGFRVFILEPGVIGSDITGYIQEFSLLNPPPYYALSYVWGQEPGIHRVVINGTANLIRPNLFHALQRIRLSGQIHVWVDSLCINQHDHSERNAQVRQMATIYQKASGVLIWLGEEDSSSKSGIDFIAQIIDEDFQWNSKWWQNYGFTALAHILERPWFRRGWVLQEAAFSKNSTIYCGDRQVYMDHFTKAIDLVQTQLSSVLPILRSVVLANFYESPAVRLLDTINGAFDKSADGKIIRHRMTLETLVELGTSSETTDKRDAIYALLNLSNNGASSSQQDQSVVIIPDYGKSILDVFVEFVLHCSYSGSLDIICRPWAPTSSLKVYSLDQDTQNDHAYPSWIASRDNLPFGNPSWRSSHRLNGNSFVGGNQKRTYNAHYGLKPYVLVGRNKDGTCDGSLYARGIIVGEVVQISTRLADAIITKECLEILATISPKPNSDVVSLLDVIWRTLCADRDEKGEPAPLTYREAMLYLLQISFESPRSDSLPNLLKDMSSIDIEELVDTEIPEYVKAFLKVIRGIIWNRRTFRLKINNSIVKLLVGLVPQKAKTTDLVCMLYGCSVPVVLRKWPISDDKFCWMLIGEAYVDGIMNGEAIRFTSSEVLKSIETMFELH